jgi:iron complex outermembrane receptor protein
MENTKATSVWGNKSVLDTPYSVFGTSADLIQNYMAGDVDQVFKMNPLVSNVYDFNTFNRAEPTLRGVSATSNFVNGVPTNAYLGTFTELYDSIDVYTGLSGFLYGGGSVGGFVNYNLKRYTPGFQNGGTGVQNQDVAKWATSVALDIHLTNKLLVTADAYAGNRWVHGRQAMFNLGADYAPIDGSLLYTPKNTFNGVKSTYEDVGAKYTFNDHFDIRGILQHKHDYNPMFYPLVIQIAPGTPQYQDDDGT